MKTPSSILPLSEDWQNGSWRDYDIHELGMWVHVLVKRAYHRTKTKDAKKDLEDAQNYLNMMQEHINQAKEDLNGLDSILGHG